MNNPSPRVQVAVGQTHTQGKACYIPQGHQNRRSDPERNHQLVELFQMVFLLIPHFLGGKTEKEHYRDMARLGTQEVIRNKEEFSAFSAMKH